MTAQGRRHLLLSCLEISLGLRDGEEGLAVIRLTEQEGALVFAAGLEPHFHQVDVCLAALGNFLAADDSPWELLMTTGFIYALPPAAIYYAFKRYMVGGLTAGAVKS